MRDLLSLQTLSPRLYLQTTLWSCLRRLLLSSPSEGFSSLLLLFSLLHLSPLRPPPICGCSWSSNVRWWRNLGWIWWLFRFSGYSARMVRCRGEVGVGFWVGFHRRSISPFYRSLAKLVDRRRVATSGGSSASDLFFYRWLMSLYPGGVARRRV